MDRNCFNCAYFPNCETLRKSYSEDDSDEYRVAILECYGKNCKNFNWRYNVMLWKGMTE
jgi:hypothetical protein